MMETRSRMKLVVGLGNPGEKYENNRHNVGFIVLDEWVRSQNLKFSPDKKSNSKIAKTKKALFVKPQTFMNNSGESVSKLVSFYKADLNNLLVVHDDVDMSFGATRLRKSMGSGGHRGVESVIGALGSIDFWRLKVGVGRPEDGFVDTEEWVLSNFNNTQISRIKNDIIPLLNGWI